MRIVLAEDEALLREGLGLLLERAGHDVVASVATLSLLRPVLAGRKKNRAIRTPSRRTPALPPPEPRRTDLEPEANRSR